MDTHKLVSDRELWQSPKDKKLFRRKELVGESKRFTCYRCGEAFRNPAARNIHQEECCRNG